jgi:hypothetical protein
MTASARTVFTALGQVIHTVHKTGLFAESKEVTYYYDTLCAPATEAD